MATLNTTVSDNDVASGEEVTVTLSATGLNPAVAPVVNNVVVSGRATLNDGTELQGENVQITVTRPGIPAQSVVSYALDVVSGSATFTQTSPGVFKATLTA